MKTNAVQCNVTGEPQSIPGFFSSKKGEKKRALSALETAVLRILGNLRAHRVLKFNVKATCIVFNRHEPASKIGEEIRTVIATKIDRKISMTESWGRIPPQQPYTLQRLVQESEEGCAITESQLSEAYKSAFLNLVHSMFPIQQTYEDVKNLDKKVGEEEKKFTVLNKKKFKNSEDASKEKTIEDLRPLNDVINNNLVNLLYVEIDKTIHITIKGLEESQLSEAGFIVAPGVFKELLCNNLAKVIAKEEDANTADDILFSNWLKESESIVKLWMTETKKRFVTFYSLEKLGQFFDDPVHTCALEKFFEQFKVSKPQ